MRLVLFAILMILLSGCATKVEPISIHDPNVPIEARRLIADAQDSVSIARAKRDEAQQELQRQQAWRSQVRAHREWPADATGLVSPLTELVESRVRLAQLRRDRAEVQIVVAEAELELITARVAVRNDLAVYDLDLVVERVNRRRERARVLDREIALHMEKLDGDTRAWWKAYAAFVQQGGDGSALFPIFDRPRI